MAIPGTVAGVNPPSAADVIRGAWPGAAIPGTPRARVGRSAPPRRLGRSVRGRAACEAAGQQAHVHCSTGGSSAPGPVARSTAKARAFRERPAPVPAAGLRRRWRTRPSSPGLPMMAHRLGAHARGSPRSRRTGGTRRHPRRRSTAGTSAQQAFISAIAPGAMAAQQQVRRPGVGDDRAGHRRIRLGPERPGHQGPQPVRHQGHRPGGQRPAADPGVRERPAGDQHRLVPRLPQRRRRASTDHGELLATSGYYQQGHGQPADPERLRRPL